MQKSLPVSILITLIGLYRRLISPWLGARCRFVPSCSDYAREAVQHYGATRGSIIAVKRLCRCHPWGGEGYDPLLVDNPQITLDRLHQAECRHHSGITAQNNHTRTNG
ncbi:MAG: membrane protein insertion efficiency factor YidD [Arenicella sp.]|nr:membrane protein insertion efficiency factor YidD [Arenicella sp.]